MILVSAPFAGRLTRQDRRRAGSSSGASADMVVGILANHPGIDARRDAMDLLPRWC